MEWNLTQIPKILHEYWGGSKLSYLRYLTVKTFIDKNPDWEIRFYYPTHPTIGKTWLTHENKLAQPETDFTQKLMELPITKTPIDFTTLGYSNEMSEVHKSDIIRLHLLSTVGGLWSDMDIFYFKPMSWFYLNDISNNHIETFYCNRDYGHSIGFLMATPGNRFFEKLYESSKHSYSPYHYQTFGADLYNAHFRNEGSVEQITPFAINISMDVVYSHRAGETEDLLNPNKSPNFTHKSLGIHWFGGDLAWKNFLIDTDGGQYNVPDCIIGNLLKKYEI